MNDTTALVKSATDIVALVGEYVPLTTAGGKFKGLCPFHDDRTPSLTVDPRFQSFKCWACGAGGDVYSFLQRIERIDFLEAKRRLAERAGIALGANRSESGDLRQSAVRALAWAAERYREALFDSSLGAEARAYLQSRKLSEDTARRYGLGFAPPAWDWLLRKAERDRVPTTALEAARLIRANERYPGHSDFFGGRSGRLMFAIRDERRRVVAFAGRVMPSAGDDAGPKYVNSAASDVYRKSEVLYGLDGALDALRDVKEPQPRRLVLMEGYTDCLAAWQAGFPFAVAACGTAFTPQHLRKLRQHADAAVLMYDGDKAGAAAADKALELFLESDVLVRIAALPGGQDPADFINAHGVAALVDIVDKAPDALRYVLGVVRQRHRFDTLAGRLAAQEEMLEKLAALPVATSSEQRIRFDATLKEIVVALGADEGAVRLRIDELRRERRPKSKTPLVDAAASEPPADPQMDRREIGVVQFIAARPGQASAALAEAFPPATVRHPRLRRIVDAAYDLFRIRGPSATTDQLRETLNDAELDSLVFDLAMIAPADDEAFAVGLRELFATLAEERRRTDSMALRAAVAEQGGEDDDHLEWVRRVSRPRLP